MAKYAVTYETWDEETKEFKHVTDTIEAAGLLPFGENGTAALVDKQGIAVFVIRDFSRIVRVDDPKEGE